MEKPTSNNKLSQIEKEALLTSIWKDKKGRIPDAGPYALYVKLDSPQPSLAQITSSLLEELSESPFGAENWARTWGRVVICVGPSNKRACTLGLVNDPENKAFMPVKTTAKINPLNFIGEFPQGEAGQIIVNSQPTTVEGFLISYIHLVDELIWDLSKKKNYGDALNEIKNDGFSLASASEDEILFLKKTDPQTSVRLYGSGVNKDVPKVMGAVVLK